MKMTVTYVPAPSEAIGDLPRTYDLNPGDPLPSIGDAITFEDWTKLYRAVSRSFHYVDQNTLQVFFGFERDKSAK